MIRTQEQPDWAGRTFLRKQPDVISFKSSVFHETTGPMYFTGVLGEMLRIRRIPLSLSFFLDMEAMACVVRMEFAPGGDGMNADKHWRVLYSYFEIEDFAKIWNVQPDQIHGILSEDISMHVLPTDGTWPVQMGDGIAALAFQDGKFILRREAAYEREVA